LGFHIPYCYPGQYYFAKFEKMAEQLKALKKKRLSIAVPLRVIQDSDQENEG
jgi:hypothetical protein